MSDEPAVLTEEEANDQALRLQALCVLIAWPNVDRADRLGVWSREIVSYLGTDEVVAAARRISFKEGH